MSLFVILGLTGAVAGIMAGLLGVGGGLVVVPVIFYLNPLEIPLEFRMHVAIGTSLAVMVITASATTRTHFIYKAVDTSVLYRWGPRIILGAILGVICARFSRYEVLLLVFGVIALVVAGIMAYTSEGFKVRTSIAPSIRENLTIMIGFISALLGIGGGTFMVPLLSMRGLSIQRSIATAAATGLLIAIPGSIGFIISGWGVATLPGTTLGFVSLSGTVLIAVVSLITAPLSARVVHRSKPWWLRKLFAVFLAVVGGRMLLSALSIL